MSENSEKINRAITSFNNQITRITTIKDSFTVGSKVREKLEDEIKKLIDDRDRLKKLTGIERGGITENVNVVLKRADKIDESPDGEMLSILRKLDKNSITKKMTFFISLSAGAVMFVIGVIVGYFLP